MNSVILTVTHKDFDDDILPDGYKVIQVGGKETFKGGVVI